MFAVVRHPDITAVGTCPQEAYEFQRLHGWVRVSPWVENPADLHLPDYENSYVDLDAPPPAETAETADDSPAVPETEEESA